MLISLFFLDVFLMCIAYGICIKTQKADWVDISWALSLALNAIICLFVFQASFLKTFVCSLFALWFLRLGSHLLQRVLHSTEEDSRYQALRGYFESNSVLTANTGFFIFFMFQAGLVFLFALPVVYLSASDAQLTNSVYILCALIFLLAFIGEAIADKQLLLFKQAHDNKVCNVGLWRYSRHPNYFFEWLHWLIYLVLGISTQMYWLCLYPFIMYLFLVYMTGIPFSEKQALLKRGQNYAKYQDTTSMFFLWPPK